MIGNQPIRNLIRENKTAQMYSNIQTGSREGMNTLDQSLQKLVMTKTVTVEDARALAKQPENFN